MIGWGSRGGGKWVGAWKGDQQEAFHLDSEGSLRIYSAMKDDRDRGKRGVTAGKGSSMNSGRDVFVCVCVPFQRMKWLQHGQSSRWAWKAD